MNNKAWSNKEKSMRSIIVTDLFCMLLFRQWVSFFKILNLSPKIYAAHTQFSIQLKQSKEEDSLIRRMKD